MFINHEANWAWWHRPVGNPALGMLRQEDMDGVPSATSKGNLYNA